MTLGAACSQQDDAAPTTTVINNYYYSAAEDEPVMADFDHCTLDPSTMDVWDQGKVFRYYVSIDDQQLAILNSMGSVWYGDTHMYPYADFLVVWDEEGNCGLIQKPEVQILGEMNWTALPGKAALGFDTDEFVPNQELGGDEKPSFRSGLYGGHFREPFMYNYLIPSFGYVSKDVVWQWLSADFWGGLPEDGGFQLDYQLHRRWKKDQLNKEFGKNGWVAAWEGFGDFKNTSWITYPSCQEAQDKQGCDDTLLDPFAQALESPDEHGGIIAVLDTFMEGGHEAFFTFWASELLMGQWDGYYAAQHNYVVVLLANGRFVFLHHSLDLAMNKDFEFGSQLFGSSVATQACYANDACATAFVDHLEQMNVQWQESVPAYVEELERMYVFLDEHEMLFKEDPKDLQDLQIWITDRPETIELLIQRYRECGLTSIYPQLAGGGDTAFWGDTGTPCVVDTGGGSGGDSASDTGTLPSDSVDSGVDSR